MSKPERSRYCVCYLDNEEELQIRENVGVDELAHIFRDVQAMDTEDQILVFNMKGISQPSDIAAHPENSYTLITVNQGDLELYDAIGPEIESLISEAERYYLVDDVYFITLAALHELVK